MFEITDTSGAPVTVCVSFWQCVKAGVGFTLGAALLVPLALLGAGVLGLSWAALLALLPSPHR